MRTPYTFKTGVKSIQRGTASVGGGNSTLNVTINSVDITKSVIVLAAFAEDTGLTFYANLTTATNLALVYYSPATSFNVTWQVVEYY